MPKSLILLTRCADTTHSRFGSAAFHISPQQTLFPLSMFDSRDTAGHGTIFKLGKGDGAAVQHDGFALAVLVGLDVPKALAELKDLLPMSLCQPYLVE